MNWMALLAVIVSLVVLYLVGTVISALFKNEEQSEPFYDTFVSLVVGFLAVTTIYAIVKTCGNTVQLAVLLLGVLYLMQNKITKPVFRFSLMGVGIACACSLFFFCFHGYFYYAQLVDNIPHFDNCVYAYNSYINAVNGIETTGVYLEGMAKATPYHYIEGWLTALIASVFGVNYLETYSICLICILSSIVVVGIISLAKTYTDNPFVVVLACCTIFLSAVLLDYSPIKQAMAMGENLKNLISAVFLIGFIISLRKDSANVLWLLCLPIANAALAPITMSTVFIYSFVLFYVDRNKKKMVADIVSILSISLFIALFYFFQKNNFPAQTHDARLLSDLWSSYSVGLFGHLMYRTIVNYVVYIPYFLPLIVLFFVKRTSFSLCLKSNWRELSLLVISVICGLICHFLYYPIDNYDSGQLDINFTMILMDIVVLVSLIYVFCQLTQKVSLTFYFSFWIIVSMYNIWVFEESIKSRRSIGNELRSYEYRENILNYFEEHKTNRIGCRLLSEQSSKAGIAYKNVGDIYSMGFMANGVDGLLAINLTPLNNLSEDQQHWNSIIPQTNVFNSVYPDSVLVKNVDSLQLEFIKKYELGYIVCDSKSEIPTLIQPLVDTVFLDSKTGEQFAFLKQGSK